MATSAHTTSVTAPGITSAALVTNVSISQNGDDPLDASHLGQSAGASAHFVASPFTGTVEVSISFIGTELPEAGDTGALTVTGGVAVSLSNCVCTSSTQTGNVGELITGDATYSEIET
tara:strand:- start:1029 stop:1382 length:354 start_codon:yes stop_codon:yes gene_type:complete